MKIGITGGNGFLGSYLKQAITINNYELVQISLGTKKTKSSYHFLKII